MPLDGELTARLDALRQRARARRTASWRDRREKLRALRRAFVERRQSLEEALARDLGRPATETDLVEYLPVIGELDRAIADIHRWSQPRNTSTPFALFGARSQIIPQPKGVLHRGGQHGGRKAFRIHPRNLRLSARPDRGGV
jgi:acyl-CoA reductase-like NAD-dependent aldehyde dehydrogenase